MDEREARRGQLVDITEKKLRGEIPPEDLKTFERRHRVLKEELHGRPPPESK